MPTPFSLSTPLPPGELRFESISHAAGLSVLEETQLQLLSDRADIEPEKLLGEQITLTLQLRDSGERHLNGYVVQFGIGRHQGRYFGYQARVVPWLWFLTRRSDCRIFQEMTVPDIVKQVFDGHKEIAKFELKLVNGYRKRTYCVQYRETDFNFVARLMEDEGIYWYFEHSDGDHKLIIADSSSAHEVIDGDPQLRYYGNLGQTSPDVDIISHWHFSRQVKTGKVALTSYDFERPSTSLLVESAQERPHRLSKYEQFDFQGDYLQKADGEQQAGMRIDELHTRHEQITGMSNAMGLATGRLFTLALHPRDDQNAEYLCVQTQISAQLNGSESGEAHGDYQCSFAAIPATQQYRPPRRTPKPFVQGPQTAVVVGPAGEEIYTDKYGRVKVQFHWDRYGKKNEQSSCWMRVSSPWAGKSFGFVQVPRITQEVVVDFLEGDPDQPIITGRVYNAEQMPPWELPANATQSGVLSRSSKGGSYDNANALRFEDKKGAEQLWLHAEKNQDIEVENDETHWVGHDRTKTIDHDETSHIKHDRTETVDNDETITIHGQRTETVDKDETITIHQNRTETVDANETISIGGNRDESVKGNESVYIKCNRDKAIDGNDSLAVKGNQTEEVTGNREVAIKSNEVLNVDGTQDITAKGMMTVISETEMLLFVKGAAIRLAPDGITLNFGGSTIKLDAAGVTTTATKISLNG